MVKSKEIYYDQFSSPVGELRVLVDERGILGVDFERESIHFDSLWQKGENHPLILQVKQAIQHYFQGEKNAFSHLPLAPQGTAFQLQVWQILLSIPFGQTMSYGEIAKQLGKPNAMRAVGGAVGRNPISIIIPCHRVLGRDKNLTGFGGGLPAKRILLQHENIAYVDKGIEFVKPKLFSYLKKM